MAHRSKKSPKDSKPGKKLIWPYSNVHSIASSLDEDPVHHIRKALAAIQYFELPCSTVVSVEFCYILFEYLDRGLFAIDLSESVATTFVGVDSLDELNKTLFTLREYSLNKKMKNSPGSLLMISTSFSRYFRLISPGRQTFVIALIISFLLDCFVNVCFRSLG